MTTTAKSTDFAIAGSPSTNATKLKALARWWAACGRYRTDHRLTALFPEALDSASGTDKKIMSTDLEMMWLDGMLLDAAVTKNGVHFTILPARFKQPCLLTMT